ncbi:transglutaminase domain-containing protein [Bacillus sp. S/N-304-OC-R1]|uniref:transglutaminase domain-containing protein n=1 Tax=Bacillus sp. S/N-304-OC-R1 TaxID=2758034 RepID=UPI001C8EDDCE|nr:transglutaminase-like domain-containing protein [Bacillus sp. S/N-304-OC-R1]MBY0124368.1 transglutaminase domain-containing protein [Bacillus sp. S/N-304-OC-R1]
MNRKINFFTILFSFLSSFLILSACSDASPSDSETKAPKKEENKYEKLAEEKNKEIEFEPIELSSYSEEIGVTFKNPEHKKFAVNGVVMVEGEIEKHTLLKSDYAWIKVYSKDRGPAGDKHEYFTPIEEGKFKQAIHFFNGEGEYRITVQLPSTDRDNYFYDTAEFEVFNVNPDLQRDLTYTKFGREADLAVNLDSSYVEEEEIFQLKGKAGKLTDSDTLMITLHKDSETWKHVISIKDGKFSYDVPLFYGEGVHELEVLVPDKERENYYQTATTILIDNKSDRVMQPIEFSKTYIERGVSLEYPLFGGEESDGIFNVKGSIDPKAEFAAETTHIYITSKKGEDEALDVIPVKNFKFDDSFYLRFGPGTYDITVSVPEIKEENSDYFRYFGFAQFEVESKALKDERDLLPSRGIQSDAPEMKELVKELTAGISSDREKAKAIYDYVAKNISYDVAKYENDEFEWDDSALKTLQLKTGVCQDYAYLTVALLRASQIEARMIEGRAGQFWPGKHAWVEANIDGSWLIMDPTWGSGYLQDGKFVPKFTDTYFDPDMEQFNKTHTRTGVIY